MKEIIQNLLFPQSDMLEDHYRLYYRGNRGALISLDGKKELHIAGSQHVEFNTYFNGCSYRKWKNYTNIGKISLQLRAAGAFQLKLFGYSLPSVEPQKTLLGTYPFDSPKSALLEIGIPETKDQMVGFEIETISDCVFSGGCYTGEFPDSRPVNLAISTTTCRKEEYITRNAATFKADLLDCGGDIADHLFINIVDNGRTLKPEDLPADPRIRLFPNKNTGGAGGFARGMIEAMRQKEGITHVLLMDDDVLIQPESIYRTYVLLKHVTEKHRLNFVSGAMLYMENASIQKEDVGTVSNEGYFIPLKREFNQEYLWDNLTNEKEYPLPRRSYAAWWYCCIPVETIRKKGLPMPVFVRGDDMEYGLRCTPGFMTMNGVCVWHMGFAGKFNVGMDHYQVNRNLLINQATTGLLNGVDIMKKVRLDFRKHMLRLDYDSAEIALRALEDYLKGPEFIKQDQGEKILMANNALGHKMVPLSELGNPDVGLGDPYNDPPRRFLEKWLFRLTYNGHRFRFLCFLKPGIMSVPYNDVYTPSRIAFRKELIAVNPATRTGYMLTRNQKRYRELMNRYHAAMKAYIQNKDRLKKEYRKNRKVFTSMEFWKNYLEIR